jgi:uncharacterized membrane protein YvbJ
MAASTGENVKKMKVRIFRQKLILWTVIVALFIIIITLMYVLYQHGGHF